MMQLAHIRYLLVGIAIAVSAIFSYNYYFSPPTEASVFRLPQGEVLACERYKQQACGMFLEGCGYDKAGIFSCMREVTYIGPDTPGADKQEVPAEEEQLLPIEETDPLVPASPQ